MRPVVGFALSPRTADHELSRHVSRNYAAAFDRLGYDSIFVPVGRDAPEGLGALIRSEARILFSHGGWLMSPRRGALLSRLGLRDSTTRQALTEAGKPVMALIADDPFMHWQRDIFANLPSRAGVFFIDPSFIRGIEHWVPSGCTDTVLPCGYLLDGHGPAPTAEKDIDLLFVGSLRDPDEFLRQARADTAAWELASGLIERGLDDHATPLTVHADALRPARDGRADLDDPMVRRALQHANGYIRARWRHAMAVRLALLPATIVTDRMPAVAGAHPRLQVLPPCPFPEMLRLFRRSRACFVSQPPFPGAVNERLIFCWQARCVPVTTPNPRTRQMFEHGRELLFVRTDLEDLEEQAAQALDEAVAEPIRERALEYVYARHTPDGNVRRMLQTMRAHGLLEDDLPIPPGPSLEVPPTPAWRI